MPEAAGFAEQTVGEVHLFDIGPFEEIEHDMSGMFAEPAVGFPLRLVVELVAGGLVRERPVARAILQHVRRLVPGQRRFKEQDRPLVHAPRAVVMVVPTTACWRAKPSSPGLSGLTSSSISTPKSSRTRRSTLARSSKATSGSAPQSETMM